MPQMILDAVVLDGGVPSMGIVLLVEDLEEFLELSSLLEPGRPPKNDKLAILGDAIQVASLVTCCELNPNNSKRQMKNL
ncbi:transcription factor bHLH34-like [Rhododendron vialii]|uniref:transcription factor bHLH34-like n=1 Tax=Rhododendron vialii TaxID=182163 RepID=UPI00265E1297|nr:transcription factor bHLH34-like [Rhododendron vialii]